MAKSTLLFSPKDRIDHTVHGLGTVLAVNERYTTIEFDAAGTRKFMTTMVKLAPSNAPAPAKPVRSRKKKVSKPS
jgi:hypothetical protein